MARKPSTRARTTSEDVRPEIVDPPAAMTRTFWVGTGMAGASLVNMMLLGLTPKSLFSKKSVLVGVATFMSSLAIEELIDGENGDG